MLPYKHVSCTNTTQSVTGQKISSKPVNFSVFPQKDSVPPPVAHLQSRSSTIGTIFQTYSQESPVCGILKYQKQAQAIPHRNTSEAILCIP